MKKKRIKGLVLCIAICMIGCISVHAATKSFTVKHSKVNASCIASASYLEGGIFADVVTYYAKIAGSERHLITKGSKAKFYIDKGQAIGSANGGYNVLNLDVYYGHEYTTTQHKFWNKGSKGVRVELVFSGQKAVASVY